MAGTETLNEDGSPPHHEARKSSAAQDGGQKGWVKKHKKYIILVFRLVQYCILIISDPFPIISRWEKYSNILVSWQKIAI